MSLLEHLGLSINPHLVLGGGGGYISNGYLSLPPLRREARANPLQTANIRDV